MGEQLAAQRQFEEGISGLKHKMRSMKKKSFETSKLLCRAKNECFTWRKDCSNFLKQMDKLESESIGLKESEQEKERNISSFNDLKSSVPKQSSGDESSY